MYKELCEENYKELIELLNNDFSKECQFLEATTKLLLSLYCAFSGNDWKKDLKWERDQPPAPFIPEERPIPKHYLSPSQFVRHCRIFSKAFITSTLSKLGKNSSFAIKRKNKWRFDALEFLNYVKNEGAGTLTRRQADLFLSNQSLVQNLKDFIIKK